MYFVALCSVDIRTGRPEWGAEPGKKYFVLTICGICGRAVNFDKKFPDPWSATLDHTISIRG